MRRLAAATIVVLVTFALFADQKNETIDQLKARAERAQSSDQVKLLLEVAKRQLDNADKAYEDGDSDNGKAAVGDVGSYGERAGEVAISTGKRLKQTEIELRKLSERLEAIRRSVNVDDRPPLQEAGDRLERVRTRLLDRMFKGKK